MFSNAEEILNAVTASQSLYHHKEPKDVENIKKKKLMQTF